MRHGAKLGLGLVPLLLAACAQPGLQADVTRFHLAPPPPRSTVAVVSADPRVTDSLEFRGQAAAVARGLEAAGYRSAPPESAEVIATMTVTQSVQAGVPKPSPFRIGIGGGTFGGGVGIGGSVNVPVGQSTPTQVRTTMLALQMKRKSDQSVVWEGRATTVEDGVLKAPVVEALAGALLQGFPGESGKTVRVKLK
ncbi:DUF4136 domain-containing protein [Sandaracinobacteroides saxicola]|uniref:DUF4136 domain-containing protein n=1 Tax=Sandaracinobacteroides saxicola TaxID=2759707 RepID=A0A7G5IF33_9SPHN|nr:DUF4136 domain-containing protein [Sandaracinobacteroides saxicola]QMW21975.1 DUF4136 domain-containing protein [Sandaracinobacteroides saxicola]